MQKVRVVTLRHMNDDDIEEIINGVISEEFANGFTLDTYEMINLVSVSFITVMMLFSEEVL